MILVEDLLIGAAVGLVPSAIDAPVLRRRFSANSREGDDDAIDVNLDGAATCASACRACSASLNAACGAARCA